MKVNRSRIVLDPWTIRDATVADIRLDGHRVWSETIPYSDGGQIALEWPRALRSRLRGRSSVSVHDSASGREIDRADVRFGLGRGRVEVVDARGRWLAMTKWDRLGPVLEGREAETTGRLLASSRRLVDDLEAAGYQVYIVGGTLLGIVRNGEMLPHDDDVDLAFLAQADNPADLGLISYRMERTLAQLGYVVVRHSLAHLEVEFFNDAGEPDHYVDIFTGFFSRDGDYCQPFALKGPQVVESDLVPVRSRDMGGVDLPEPNRPDAWLAYAYGEGWRIPDPTFKFVTPRGVRRRFETWFGVYNRGRVYWDKAYLERTSSSGVGQGRRAIADFLRSVPPDARILDLGCGDGRWSVELARNGNRVTGVDYSHEALRLARAHDVHGVVDFRYLNINDRASLFEFGARMLGTGDEWYVFAHHSVQTLTKVNRQNVLYFLELVLRGRGYADVVSDKTASMRYTHAAPSTWHLPPDWVAAEAVSHRLALENRRQSARIDHGQPRIVQTVRVRSSTVPYELTASRTSPVQKEDW